MTLDALDHEHAAALLPWLANGTLDGDERERVERHVRRCLPCRAELAAQTRLMVLVQRQPVVPLSADEGFERLRARLDRTPRGRSRPMRRTLLALAAAAAVAAIGLPIATGLLGTRETPPDAYRTLSDAGAGAALIDVIFADGVRESEMRALLEELDAEIVAGPSPGLGRYTLRLRSPDAARTDPAGVARRLLDDARVRFAGPTFAPPPHPEGEAAGAEDPG